MERGEENVLQVRNSHGRRNHQERETMLELAEVLHAIKIFRSKSNLHNCREYHPECSRARTLLNNGVLHELFLELHDKDSQQLWLSREMLSQSTSMVLYFDHAFQNISIDLEHPLLLFAKSTNNAQCPNQNDRCLTRSKISSDEERGKRLNTSSVVELNC